MLHEELRQFTGTDSYHVCTLNQNVVCTDGVAYLLKEGKCYWLADLIASYLMSYDSCVDQYGEDFASFHFWTLTKTDDDGAEITAKTDFSEPALITQDIEYTDFQFDGDKPFRLFVGAQELSPGRMGFVVMLPSEH